VRVGVLIEPWVSSFSFCALVVVLSLSLLRGVHIFFSAYFVSKSGLAIAYYSMLHIESSYERMQPHADA